VRSVGLVELVRLQADGGRTEADNTTLLLGTIAFVVIATVALTLVREVPKRRRRRAEQRWAAQRQWVVRGDQALAERMLGLFGVGTSCRVSHLIAGGYAGRPAMTFEYWEGGGNTSVKCHVVAVSLPVRLPGLRLSPEAMTDQVVEAVGGQDIAFESEEFNRAWRVRADDAKFAHDVLHPRMMERLMAGDAQGLSVWVYGSEILCWIPGRADLASVDERLAVLTAVVDAIPRFVWLDHGYDPGPGVGAAAVLPTVGTSTSTVPVPATLTAPVPVAARTLRDRVARRTVLSSTSRATRRNWPVIIMTGLVVVSSGSLCVVMAVLGAGELAVWCGSIAVVVGGSAVLRGRVGRGLRTAARERGH